MKAPWSPIHDRKTGVVLCATPAALGSLLWAVSFVVLYRAIER